MKHKAVNASAAISCFPAFRMKFKESQIELCTCATLVSFVDLYMIELLQVTDSKFGLPVAWPLTIGLLPSQTNQAWHFGLSFYWWFKCGITYGNIMGDKLLLTTIFVENETLSVMSRNWQGSWRNSNMFCSRALRLFRFCRTKIFNFLQWRRWEKLTG